MGYVKINVEKEKKSQAENLVTLKVVGGWGGGGGGGRGVAEKEKWVTPQKVKAASSRSPGSSVTDSGAGVVSPQDVWFHHLAHTQQRTSPPPPPPPPPPPATPTTVS